MGLVMDLLTGGATPFYVFVRSVWSLRVYIHDLELHSCRARFDQVAVMPCSFNLLLATNFGSFLVSILPQLRRPKI
ncbi:hypothetical protein V8F06_006027 [Rhypophila decipiens]